MEPPPLESDADMLSDASLPLPSPPPFARDPQGAGKFMFDEGPPRNHLQPSEKGVKYDEGLPVNQPQSSGAYGEGRPRRQRTLSAPGDPWDDLRGKYYGIHVVLSSVCLSVCMSVNQPQSSGAYGEGRPRRQRTLSAPGDPWDDLRGKYYGIHSMLPSVCLSVCLSVNQQQSSGSYGEGRPRRQRTLSAPGDPWDDLRGKYTPVK